MMSGHELLGSHGRICLVRRDGVKSPWIACASNPSSAEHVLLVVVVVVCGVTL